MPASLRDFRDLDLLLKIAAESNGEGWLDTKELAEAMGFQRARDIVSRLNWMRHYDMLHFDQERRMWRLTDGARRVTQARLRASAAKTLEELPESHLVEAMAAVTARYRLGSPMTAHMLRREFLFGSRR